MHLHRGFIRKKINIRRKRIGGNYLLLFITHLFKFMAHEKEDDLKFHFNEKLVPVIEKGEAVEDENRQVNERWIITKRRAPNKFALPFGIGYPYMAVDSYIRTKRRYVSYGYSDSKIMIRMIDDR